MSSCLSGLLLPFESGLCFTWHPADSPGEAGKHASCVWGFIFRPPTPHHPQASVGGDRGAGIGIRGALPAQRAEPLPVTRVTPSEAVGGRAGMARSLMSRGGGILSPVYSPSLLSKENC